MDARLFRFAACFRFAVFVRFAVLAPPIVLAGALSAFGATFSSPNFTVTAPTADFAKQVADTAERYRSELAQEWLGHTLRNWFRPCRVNVTVGQIGAGGATTFTFAAGQVYGWNMNVQGTPERILDSVIPHEVSHTIFASFFRRPLPRWADEGAATLVEHESERRRQQLLLQQVFNSPQRIPLTKLISMKDYPADMQSVLTLYAEGYSLADYLVQSGGKARYLKFLKDANDRDWNYAIKTWYGLPNVVSLEQRWTTWVTAGSPEIEDKTLVQADTQALRSRGIVVRSQSPDDAGSVSQQPETSRAARPTKSFPRGDQLEAPSPIARTAVADRLVERTAEVNVDPVEANVRRQAGRERMLREGWQPVTPARSSDAAAIADRDSQDEAAPANESSAHRRFRQAKLRQDAEPDPFETTQARAPKSIDPFAETRTAREDRAAATQSPFQAEN